MKYFVPIIIGFVLGAVIDLSAHIFNTPQKVHYDTVHPASGANVSICMENCDIKPEKINI